MPQTKALKNFLFNLWLGFVVCGLVAQEVGIAETFSQLYEFDLNGSSAKERFFLMWDLGSNTLKSIDVLDKESNEKVQSIDLQSEGLKIDVQQLTAHGQLKSGKELREKIFDMVDFNFDGYGDLRLLREFPFEPGKKRYSIYLYNTKKKLYERHQELSGLANPKPNHKGGERQIDSDELTNKDKQVFQRKTFTIDKANVLSLKHTIEQVTIDPKSNLLEYRARIKGPSGLVEVCRWERSTEGSFIIKAGKRMGCKKFLEDVASW